MHIPESLAPLFDNGIIERVVRPLMSGKEAQVYLVISQGELRVAKVYKDAQNRSFKNRAEYTEGRKTRNSRDQRAIEKRSKHGRSQDEAAWKSTEVDMIHRLHAGGVRVPTPYAFVDGVLIMECVADLDGNPAPRLGDVAFEPEAAQIIYDRVIRQVVRMLAVGVVHGDLSDFNILVAGDEPVIIDFPQSVDTASNTNARRLLLRDVENVHRFLLRHVPKAPRLPYAEEMWELHENAALTADTRLSGRYRPTQRRTSDDSVLDLIHDADRDERARRDRLGLRGGPRPPLPVGEDGFPTLRRTGLPVQPVYQGKTSQPRGPKPNRGPQPGRGGPPGGPQQHRGPPGGPPQHRGPPGGPPQHRGPPGGPPQRRGPPGGPPPHRGPPQATRPDPTRPPQQDRRPPPPRGPAPTPQTPAQDEEARKRRVRRSRSTTAR